MSVLFTLTDSPVFHEGTTVKAYPTTNWPTPGQPSGAPIGSASAEGTISSGSVTFSGLEKGKKYWAVAEVGGVYRYVKFIAGENVSQAASVLHSSELDGESTGPASKGYVDTASGLLIPKALGLTLKPLEAAKWYVQPVSGVTTGSPTLNRLIYQPLLIADAWTIDKMAVEVTAGTASSEVFVGIYEVDQSTMLPTAKLYGSLGLSGASTGVKEMTGVNLALSAGKVYGIVTTTAAATPTLRLHQTKYPILGATEPKIVLENPPSGLFLASKTSLPTNLGAETWGGSSIASVPLVAFKKA